MQILLSTARWLEIPSDIMVPLSQLAWSIKEPLKCPATGQIRIGANTAKISLNVLLLLVVLRIFMSLKQSFSHIVTWKQEIPNSEIEMAKPGVRTPGPLTPQARSLTIQQPLLHL